MFFHVLSFSFIFFHFLTFSLSLLGAQNLIFLGLNFVTISCNISFKKKIVGPSRVVTPLGPLFLFFLLFSTVFFVCSLAF